MLRSVGRVSLSSSPTAIKGYLNNPAAQLKNSWPHTGDIAIQD